MHRIWHLHSCGLWNSRNIRLMCFVDVKCCYWLVVKASRVESWTILNSGICNHVFEAWSASTPPSFFVPLYGLYFSNIILICAWGLTYLVDELNMKKGCHLWQPLCRYQFKLNLSMRTLPRYQLGPIFFCHFMDLYLFCQFSFVHDQGPWLVNWSLKK